MAEIVLDQAQVVAAVGKRITAGVAEHVGVNAAEAGAFSGPGDDIVHGLSGKGLVAFGNEEPG